MDAIDALELFRRLAVGELNFIHTLELFHPYTVLNVERILVRPHHWCIVMVKEDNTYRNVLLATSAFTEDVIFNIFVGLT